MWHVTIDNFFVAINFFVIFLNFTYYSLTSVITYVSIISSSLTERSSRLRNNFSFEELYTSQFWETCVLLDWRPFFQLCAYFFLIKSTCGYARLIGDWWMNIIIIFCSWGLIQYFWLVHMSNASFPMCLGAF